MISRRKFIKGSGALLTLAGTGISVGFSPLANSAPGADNTLVMMFFRGGMDALNFLVPSTGINRSEYESKRPNIKIPTNRLLALNGEFGLPASCSGLHQLYQNGEMAMIHAVGMPEGLSSRSHFDSMAMYERGTPGDTSTALGWLTRHLQSTNALPGNVVIPSMTPGGVPESLNGAIGVMSIDDDNTSSFHPNSGKYQEEHLVALEGMFNGNSPLDSAMQTAVANVKILTDMQLEIPDFYPNTALAEDLALIAQIIKADLGLHVAAVDFGGWDTHENSGNDGTGYYYDRLGEVSAAISAFFQDLGNAGKKDKVILATQTDFGRRVRENGNRGTDHGSAQAMMVVGGNINGGKVYGQFPGIANEDLYLNADLAVTTDFRQPLSEIVIRHLGNSDTPTVFPDYDGPRLMGLIKNGIVPDGEVLFRSNFE